MRYIHTKYAARHGHNAMMSEQHSSLKPTCTQFTAQFWLKRTWVRMYIVE